MEIASITRVLQGTFSLMVSCILARSLNFLLLEKTIFISDLSLNVFILDVFLEGNIVIPLSDQAMMVQQRK